jgi:hypothetical protein
MSTSINSGTYASQQWHKCVYSYMLHLLWIDLHEMHARYQLLLMEQISQFPCRQRIHLIYPLNSIVFKTSISWPSSQRWYYDVVPTRTPLVVLLSSASKCLRRHPSTRLILASDASNKLLRCSLCRLGLHSRRKGGLDIQRQPAESNCSFPPLCPFPIHLTTSQSTHTTLNSSL